MRDYTSLIVQIQDLKLMPVIPVDIGSLSPASAKLYFEKTIAKFPLYIRSKMFPIKLDRSNYNNRCGFVIIGSYCYTINLEEASYNTSELLLREVSDWIKDQHRNFDELLVA